MKNTLKFLMLRLIACWILLSASPLFASGSTSRADSIWVTDAQGCTNDHVTVFFWIDNQDTPIDAITIRLGYDPDMIEYFSIEEGDLTPGTEGWKLFDAFVSSPGVLMIGGFGITGEIPAGSVGTIAEVTFAVTCIGCSNGDTSGLVFQMLEDDLAGFGSTNGLFTYSCGGSPTSTPVPTNTPHPPTSTPIPTSTPVQTNTPLPTSTPIPTNTPFPTNTPEPGDWLLMEDISGCNEDEVTLRILLNNENTPIDAFTMQIGYDSTMLFYDSCVEGDLQPPGDWTMFACNQPEPGLISIGGFSLEPIPAGEHGYLVEILFIVDCPGCNQGDTSALPFLVLYDDIEGFDTYDGLFVFDCGLPTATPTTPGPTHTPAPPTNTPEPTHTPTHTPVPTDTPSPDNWLLVENAEGCFGDSIQLAVSINNRDIEIDAFTFHMAFDDTILSYVSCEEGDLLPPDGWIMFGCNEGSPGDLIVAGFSLDPVPPGENGDLVIITFDVICTDCYEGQTSPLDLHMFSDDIEGFTGFDGIFVYSCPATPTETPTVAPTNTPNHTNTPEPTHTPPPPTSTPVPTDTPAPTQTPSPTPTESEPTSTQTPIPPTHTPTEPAPTQTPTEPAPTQTPTTAPPTSTPTPIDPTATPEPCNWLGTRLEISQDELFKSGDLFWLKCHVCNNLDETMTDVPTAVILGVYGEFWFWPSWSRDFDYDSKDYEIGLTTFYALEPFVWPSVSGNVTGLDFYSGLLNNEMTQLIGEYDHLTFGYAEN